MTDRELMQMALDALDKLLDKLNADICDNSGIWDEYCDGGNAMQALRARLAQPEHEEVEQAMLEVWQDVGNLRFPHITQQEPVAFWRSKDSLADGWDELSFERAFDDDVPLYTTIPHREWQGLTEGETIDLALSAFELPEVSSETREKIHRDLVIAMNDQDSRLMLFAANIEAKLKEKNT